jgi:C4-type Zn-finger protein
MSKKLKTLDEHNSTARAVHSFDYNKPQTNGIACPKCGEELYDSQPMMTLTSNPPQKNVACMKENCGYVGYRIA